MATETEKPEPISDLFQPEQRLIYSYFNGQKVVSVDPLVLYRKTLEQGPSLSIDFKVANSPSKDAAKAYTSLMIHLRRIFDVAEYQQGGLTETEMMQLLEHFLRYCNSIKKNWSPLPTSATATLAPSASSTVDDPATPNSLDSGSTDVASCTNVPEPSPSELELPSDPSTPDSNTGKP